MGLDIRLPIGMLFVIFGIMLVVFGLFSNPSLYAQSLGVNINLAWGAVLFVFGALMFYLGARAMWGSHPGPAANARGKESRQ